MDSRSMDKAKPDYSKWRERMSFTFMTKFSIPVSISIILLIVFCSFELSFAQKGARTFTEYSRLTSKQKALIDKWAAKESMSGQARFTAMTLSQHSTFEAISNALERTKLTDNRGKVIGTAMDMIESVELVAGQEEGKGSDEQFRLYVRLIPGAAAKLASSREFSRGKDNTIFHHGYPVNYRQKGNPPTLQFSMTTEMDRADIDVDYRSSSFPKALFNGHLTAGNSDVRIGGNYPTHTSRWLGLTDWWESDVGSMLTKLVGGNSKALEPTFVPVSANGSFPDSAGVEISADEFLDLWLVKRSPDSAAKFLSTRLAACLDTSSNGAEQVFRQRRRVLFLTMMKEANKQLGKIDRIEQGVSALKPLYSSIVPLDHKAKAAYTLAHVPESYYRHFVCDGSTENWAGLGVAERDRNYGQYYATMFKFETKNGLGGGLKIFWANEGGVWKIITFDVVTA